MRQTKTARIVLLGILFLLFLQALSDFIKSIYAFGLLVTAFTIQIAAVILLFTPLLLLFFRRRPTRALLIGLLYLGLLARLAEPNLALGGRLVASGISVGAFLLLFTALFARQARPGGWEAATGLGLGLWLSIAFRAAGSGLDISEAGAFQVVSWALALAAGVLAWRVEDRPGASDPEAGAASTGRVLGLCLGLAAVILMIYFAFASPAVIARWTGFPLPLILAVLGASWTLFAALTGTKALARLLTPATLWAWNGLFLVALVLTILPHQLSLPPIRGAYPLEAPEVSPLAAFPLLLMLVLSPILLADFRLFARQLAADRATVRQLGGGFGLAALYFLVMVFFHVFTTVYDYAPVIGPVFRDRFWLVYLLAGLGMMLPLGLIRPGQPEQGLQQGPRSFAPVVVGALALLALTAALVLPLPPAPSRAADQLRVMTYNIQQGFSADGDESLAAQLAVIRKVDPDILGLQESDTARIANGNIDAVRYFADRLGMYSYYGPTTTTGTFGIALLSRFPIEGAHTFFMYSSREQTATIQARITVDGRTYNVFVTHLGNGGPLVQLEDILVRLEGLEDVILLGDHNFRPDTGQYRLVTQALEDSWLLRWPGGTDIPGYASERRIDYIFVSPGIQVLDSQYATDPASDHPYHYTVIQR